MPNPFEAINRKYLKHQVNDARNKVVEQVQQMAEQVQKLDIPEKTKELAVKFIESIKDGFKNPRVQYMLEHRQEIHAGAGSALAKNGLLLLSHHLKANGIKDAEEIKAVLKAVKEPHNEAYVKYTALDRAIQNAKQYAVAPKAEPLEAPDNAPRM